MPLATAYTIRPNHGHPDWPTKPDLDILEQTLAAAKTAKDPAAARKAAPARALQATRDRVAAVARAKAGGCSSDNLDWIPMVGDLRRGLRVDTPELFVDAWIDGDCPKDLQETILVEVAVRDGEVWTHGGRGCQYRYCTFEVAQTPEPE